MLQSNTDLFGAVAGAVVSLSLCGTAQATEFNAKAVMEKMSVGERFSFIAGVVEGLAYDRYMRDGKQIDGMKCIYGWFYDKKETIDLIESAMTKFGDYMSSVVIGTLAKKNCGE